MDVNSAILYNKNMKENKKIIGLLPGGFNLLHAGHIKAIEYARQRCDYLVCLIIRDMSHKSHKLYQENVEDRYIKLKALGDVDEVMVCENGDTFLELLTLLNYDVYFLDETYEQQGFEDGKKLVGEHRLHYMPRKHNWSTTREVLKIRNVHEEN